MYKQNNINVSAINDVFVQMLRTTFIVTALTNVGPTAAYKGWLDGCKESFSEP